MRTKTLTGKIQLYYGRYSSLRLLLLAEAGQKLLLDLVFADIFLFPDGDLQLECLGINIADIHTSFRGEQDGIRRTVGVNANVSLFALKKYNKGFGDDIPYTSGFFSFCRSDCQVQQSDMNFWAESIFSPFFRESNRRYMYILSFQSFSPLGRIAFPWNFVCYCQLDRKKRKGGSKREKENILLLSDFFLLLR